MLKAKKNIILTSKSNFLTFSKTVKIFVIVQIQQLYIPIKQSQTCPDGQAVHTFLYLLRKQIASISVHQHTYIPIAFSDI